MDEFDSFVSVAKDPESGYLKAVNAEGDIRHFCITFNQDKKTGEWSIDLCHKTWDGETVPPWENLALGVVDAERT